MFWENYECETGALERVGFVWLESEQTLLCWLWAKRERKKKFIGIVGLDYLLNATKQKEWENLPDWRAHCCLADRLGSGFGLCPVGQEFLDAVQNRNSEENKTIVKNRFFGFVGFALLLDARRMNRKCRLAIVAVQQVANAA